MGEQHSRRRASHVACCGRASLGATGDGVPRSPRVADDDRPGSNQGDGPAPGSGVGPFFDCAPISTHRAPVARNEWVRIGPNSGGGDAMTQVLSLYGLAAKIRLPADWLKKQAD